MQLLQFIFSAFFSAFVLQSGVRAQTAKGDFIFTGKLNNYSGKNIDIYFTDDSLNNKKITIAVNENTFRCVIKSPGKPFTASFRIHNLWLPLAIAPGYVINVLADGTNESTVQATLTLTGNGSIVNQFYTQAQPGALMNPDEKQPAESLTALINQKNYSDSVLNKLSSQFQDENDPYLSFFKEMARFDLIFSRLEETAIFLKDQLPELGIKTAQRFMDSVIGKEIINDISNEKYLQAQRYLWMIGQGNQYLFYMTAVNHKNDSMPPSFKDCLFQIDKLFTGKNKSYYLNIFISFVIEIQGSYEDFMKKKDIALHYTSLLENEHWKSVLRGKILAKEIDLVNSKIGQPAPHFALKDSSGEIYSLADFNGKVILMDFWASWCSPCRSQTPLLKKLYEQLAKKDEIIFVSISVRDSDAAWRKAMKEDNMPWLQLRGDSSIEANYFTYAIPKLVVINKVGKIVDFNAPGPVEEDKLKEMIEHAVDMP